MISEPNNKISHANTGVLVKFIFLFSPYFIAFLSSMAAMTIELIASRIIGSHFGNSLYTWAAVIGVLLCGSSLGNYWGGKVAGNKPPFWLLARLIFLAVLSCILILLFNWLLARYIPLAGLNWPVQIIGTTVILFLPPALLLGAVTPVTYQLAMRHSAEFGITIGNIYAWAAIGSICGTMLTGFFFIAVLGSFQIILSIALILGLLAILLVFLDNKSPDQLSSGLSDQEKTAPVVTELNGLQLAQTRFKPFSQTRYVPHTYILIFCSSAAVMMMELLGGRLLSRYYGNSLYSWTSIIGTVLAGIAVGYFIGGRFSKHRPEKFPGLLFGVSSLLVLLIIPSVKFLWVSTLLNQLSLPRQILLVAISTMLLPAITLGAISPVIYQLAFKDHPSTPTAGMVGSLNACAIAGSLCGTISAGFWLIAALGTIKVLLILTLVLAIISWWISLWRPIAFLWLLLSISTCWIAFAPLKALPVQATEYANIMGLRLESSDLLFAVDSSYQYVKVYQKEQNARHDLRMLALDSLIHGYIDLKDPADLRYEYEHIYQNLTESYVGKSSGFNAFFIGAGSYTFPRWMLWKWPKARITVAEIDPLVVKANHLALGLPADTPIRTIVGDARNVISNLPVKAEYDLFYGDAFNDLSVPWHLTTLEFVQTIKRHLKPGGAYLLNIIDNYDDGFMVGASYLTLKKAFRHVYVFCTNPLRIQNLRDTFILFASDRPIDTGRWNSDSADYRDGVLLLPNNLDYLAKRCNYLLLTDNYAPVENLLAPVVSKRRLK